MGHRWQSDGVSPGVLERAEIERQIDSTIRAIAADRYNPISLSRAPTVTVVGAPKVAGEKPLAMPPGQDVIHAMVDAALPHRRMEKIKAQLAGLSPDQRAALLRGIEGEPHANELRALIEAAQ
jgi:hypothetical protein